ncbi:MFS transporter [Candidatus Paracaedibacter symbiosus]|uniref:MFS transporter n=1 Tax=Candidatus Paracaedibacter symbiosus TaxID=244582 RepID=UPI000509DBBF|nr:MFS transporter [Candidatus Paracaedibacter symbiosus]
MSIAVEQIDKDSELQHLETDKRSYPSEVIAWTIWGCAALFYLYEYVLRVSFSVITDDLMRDFGVQATTLGVLVSCYYLAYVPLQIPCGVIVDRFGVRPVVTFSALLCSVGSLLFAYSNNLFIAEIARFLLGAGSACAYLSCTTVGANWFRSERFAVIAGVTMMMGTFGGMFGGKPFAILANAVGWRDAMLIAAAVGLGVMAAAWIIIRDRQPDQHSVKSTAMIPAKNNLLHGLKVIAKNPQSWLIGVYGGLMYVPISAFAELWGVPYLMKAHGINNETASFASAMVFLGMAAGSPLGAILSNMIKSRVKVMSWSAITTMVTFCCVVYIPNLSLTVTNVLLFMSGLLCGGQILYFAAAKEINPAEYSGTTIGFTNALVMSSGIIFQPLLGVILDFVWDGTISHEGTPVYDLAHYQHALTAVPICLLIAWLIMLFVRETYQNEAA